ncbi:hypothetical protein EB796_023338 [Bugula neritina]|uniref:Caspase family p10 domain-containing protein n=1 Tax=Bugula neritina TaxID=10212 RepID=A0A7J7IXU3_BUGNE|nr:hypothetical protein EB796_023338 [Bugula neritina]
MILCNEDRILSPFQYPCLPLSETDTHKFSDAVKQLRDCKRQAESLSVRIDVGDRGIDPAPDIGQAQKEDTEIVSPQPAKVPGVVGSEAMNRLNYDDLLVVKASMESFISKIHPVYGSLMIRALVSSMYKHAGHHDLYTIFKQVQTKVRKLCVDRNLGSGQLVVAWDTLTHMRKLYLFPGFNGNKRENNS